MAGFLVLFVMAEFLYSKEIWHQTAQFVLAGFNLSLELKSGSLWTLTGPWLEYRMRHGEWMPHGAGCTPSWHPNVTRSWRFGLICNKAGGNCSLVRPHIGVFAAGGEEPSLTCIPGWSDSLLLMIKHFLPWKFTLGNLAMTFKKKVRRSQYRTQKSGTIMQNGVKSLDCF